MSTTYLTLAQIDEAADAVRKRTSYKPRAAMILGLVFIETLSLFTLAIIMLKV